MTPRSALRLRVIRSLTLSLFLAPAVALSQTAATYYPGAGAAWQRKRPAEVGMDSAALAAAVGFAQQNEIGFLKDMAAQVREQTKNEPYPDVLGPTRDRTGQNGIVIRHGYIVAEWGDTEKVDMTFSVAKSYVATMAGLALDRGKIRNVNDKVADYVKDGGFDSPHNAKITWHMLLNQTSEWEGTLFEKPDVADRREGRDRTLKEPGTFWEYNDVRVNRASLAIMRVWGEPLPAVLKREIMDPIGASPTWEWHGYRTSFVDLNGKQVQSVSGGGHWGGGVWASTRDHARFGLLHLRRGKWNGKQLISEKWIHMATTPTDIRPVYGYMWWLNNDKGTTHAGATPKSFFARGAGGNTIWVCPELDMVVVTRWLDTRVTNDFMKMVQGAVKS
jgi:CubicO group peptidase (beta-lactamase class C family)